MESHFHYCIFIFCLYIFGLQLHIRRYQLLKIKLQAQHSVLPKPILLLIPWRAFSYALFTLLAVKAQQASRNLGRRIFLQLTQQKLPR